MSCRRWAQCIAQFACGRLLLDEFVYCIPLRVPPTRPPGSVCNASAYYGGPLWWCAYLLIIHHLSCILPAYFLAEIPDWMWLLL
jgi:hypothetical protein